MSFRGRVKNGHVEFEDPVQLPDGTEVRIEVVQPKNSNGDAGSGRSLYDRLAPVIGKATGLPPDAATNVDHYLYGHPKR